jgi:hypothetical protein
MVPSSNRLAGQAPGGAGAMQLDIRPSGPYLQDMADTHTIEVDAETAIALARQAAERGITISELVAELALVAEADDLSELERRWEAVQSGAEKTIPHEEVVEWLRTWGTSDFRPRIAR